MGETADTLFQVLRDYMLYTAYGLITIGFILRILNGYQDHDGTGMLRHIMIMTVIIISIRYYQTSTVWLCNTLRKANKDIEKKMDDTFKEVSKKKIEGEDSWTAVGAWITKVFYNVCWVIAWCVKEVMKFMQKAMLKLMICISPVCLGLISIPQTNMSGIKFVITTLAVCFWVLGLNIADYLALELCELILAGILIKAGGAAAGSGIAAYLAGGPVSVTVAVTFAVSMLFSFITFYIAIPLMIMAFVRGESPSHAMMQGMNTAMRISHALGSVFSSLTRKGIDGRGSSMHLPDKALKVAALGAAGGVMAGYAGLKSALSGNKKNGAAYKTTPVNSDGKVMPGFKGETPPSTGGEEETVPDNKTQPNMDSASSHNDKVVKNTNSNRNNNENTNQFVNQKTFNDIVDGNEQHKEATDYSTDNQHNKNQNTTNDNQQNNNQGTNNSSLGNTEQLSVKQTQSANKKTQPVPSGNDYNHPADKNSSIKNHTSQTKPEFDNNDLKQSGPGGNRFSNNSNNNGQNIAFENKANYQLSRNNRDSGSTSMADMNNGGNENSMNSKSESSRKTDSISGSLPTVETNSQSASTNAMAANRQSSSQSVQNSNTETTIANNRKGISENEKSSTGTSGTKTENSFTEKSTATASQSQKSIVQHETMQGQTKSVKQHEGSKKSVPQVSSKPENKALSEQAITGGNGANTAPQKPQQDAPKSTINNPEKQAVASPTNSQNMDRIVKSLSQPVTNKVDHTQSHNLNTLSDKPDSTQKAGNA